MHLHLCRRCHVVLHIYAASRVVSQQHCGVSLHISEMGSVVIYIIVPSHCLAEWISADCSTVPSHSFAEWISVDLHHCAFALFAEWISVDLHHCAFALFRGMDQCRSASLCLRIVLRNGSMDQCRSASLCLPIVLRNGSCCLYCIAEWRTEI